MRQSNYINMRVAIFCISLASILFIFWILLFSNTTFKYAESIDLIQILQMIVTLILVVFVASILDRENQELRAEKNLLLKLTDAIYEIIDSIGKEVCNGSITYVVAASEVKRINISIKHLYDVLESTHIKVDEEVRRRVGNDGVKLRDLLTDTPIDAGAEKKISDSNLDVAVKDGMLKFSRKKIIEIERYFDEFKKDIILLQLSINKG